MAGSMVLKVVCGVSGALATTGLAQGVALSLDAEDQAMTTFTLVYGLASLFALICFAAWVALHRRAQSSDEALTAVPVEHRAELRAVVQNAAQQMAHPSPVFWSVDNPRLKRAAAAHFPDLAVLVRAYAAAERTLNGAHAALTERISDECESRGATESEPVLRVHAALYSRLLAIAEDRVPYEGYAAEWEAAPALPGLTFMDALAWPEVAAITGAYDAERAARLTALERAREDAARETLYATQDCPTCALNLGGSAS